MPRKLCWIEVDEVGDPKMPFAFLLNVQALPSTAKSIATNYANRLPDATEEVVEAVAKAFVAGAKFEESSVMSGSEVTIGRWWDEIGEEVDRRHSEGADDYARSLLASLASAPPNKERKDHD